MEVPPQLRGLWHRKAMIFPDGTRDETTEVFWLQTGRLFADLRVPVDRPAARGRTGLVEFTDEELIALARMQGFGGELEVHGDFCRWRREIDFQPPGAPPDEANYTFERDILVETGIHAAYREDWERRTPIGADLSAFRLVEDGGREGRGGILVLAGDYFLLIEDRRGALPEAESLAALVERDLADGDRQRAIERLDMRIAFGTIDPEWVISASTFPWLEGTSLFAGTKASWRPETAILQVVNAQSEQLWRLVESTVPSPEITPCFCSSPTRSAATE